MQENLLFKVQKQQMGNIYLSKRLNLNLKPRRSTTKKKILNLLCLYTNNSCIKMNQLPKNFLIQRSILTVQIHHREVLTSLHVLPIFSSLFNPLASMHGILFQLQHNTKTNGGREREREKQKGSWFLALIVLLHRLH